MKDEKLDEDDFDGQDLEQIRDRFSKGELVGVVLPVVVKPKKAPNIESGFLSILSVRTN